MSNVNFRAAYNSAKCSGFSEQNKSPSVGVVLQASKSYPNLGALLKASLERPERDDIIRNPLLLNPARSPILTEKAFYPMKRE